VKLAPGSLLPLIAALRESAGVQSKRHIRPAAGMFGHSPSGILNGDDAAALPDADGGYTLLAAEGMHPAFVQREPWFAGLCAVLCNVNDIAAMGGRPRALVDVLFTGDERAHTQKMYEGLQAGAELFGVPIVGGHSGRSPAPCLSAAVLGKAQRLITSFDARPGQTLLACLDLAGKFRGDQPHFDGLSGLPGGDPKLARARLELLPQLSEAGLVQAGKDISMAGLLGTALMLLETSSCGARIDLAALPVPACAETQPQRWLESFPSFGFLLTAEPQQLSEIAARCAHLGIPAAAVGSVNATDVVHGTEHARYWDLASEPVDGFCSLSCS
jgi:AIR synthase-related protein